MRGNWRKIEKARTHCLGAMGKALLFSMIQAFTMPILKISAHTSFSNNANYDDNIVTRVALGNNVTSEARASKDGEMFSPPDRIYNTPDISVPAAEAILQQVRLERILKRFGYFARCNPVTAYDLNDSVAPPLVELGPPRPTRSLRPFGAHEAFTGWQRSRNIQIPKPTLCEQRNRHLASLNDQYFQRSKKKYTGYKYSGPNVPQTATKEENYKRVDLFKPFQPLGSPQRLPALKQDRNNESNKTGHSFTLKTLDIHKHIELSKKKRNTELPTKISRKTKKKRKMEVEFMKWEEGRKQYSANPVNDLNDYMHNRDSIHTHRGSEQVYREQIETQIKRGVQHRVETFGPSGKIFAKSTPKPYLIPVTEIEFKGM